MGSFDGTEHRHGVQAKRRFFSEPRMISPGLLNQAVTEHEVIRMRLTSFVDVVMARTCVSSGGKKAGMKPIDQI